jgi:hypothetical protein
MVPPGGYRGQGTHWFNVIFADGPGHCFMTTREAQPLVS